jgi:hypothetical protein
MIPTTIDPNGRIDPGLPELPDRPYEPATYPDDEDAQRDSDPWYDALFLLALSFSRKEPTNDQ